MSQEIWTSINPTVTSGTTLATLLNAFKNAVVSGFSGTSRPPNLQAGGLWIDTANAASPNYYYAFKVWTGTVDIEVFRINVNSNFAGVQVVSSDFSITQISADTTAAILGLIKQRILSNGQVADGDVVGEIQLVGRTDTATDPIVANIKWTSSDAETSSVFGGYLSFYSTPDATATLTEHLRLITGLVETVVPHKINSLRLVGQNVATSASIIQLDATKVLVEFTGATATSLHGINSGQATQEVVIHNRSSAAVTLKHQSVSATATDRIKISGSLDFIINAEASATLFYDATDTRWKLKSTTHTVASKQVKQLRGFISDWTCPSGVTQVLVTPYLRRQTMSNGHATCLDVWGNSYIWGRNTSGGLGDGTVVNKSSPVGILGGISFAKFADGNPRTENTLTENMFAIDTRGTLYAWGGNAVGQLGVGDVVPRSSPVAVLGGKKWAVIYENGFSAYGTTVDGLSYAWGKTAFGTNVAGASSISSSPVAVLGGISFEYFDSTSPSNGTDAAWGIDVNGNGYSWGGDTQATFAFGGAGAGATFLTTKLSSPVAVIGGITFKKMLLGTGGGGIYGAGLSKDGTLYSWGTNDKGQLGLGNTSSRSSPVAVMSGTTFLDFWIPPMSSASFINYDYMMALAEDGTLYAWGGNADGQLGLGDIASRSSPVAVLGGLKFKEVNVCASSAITTSGGQVYAIAVDGTMYAWGANTSGTLGLGDTTPRSSPVAVLGGIAWSHFPFRGLRAFNAMSAIAQDGTMYSWGGANADNGFGDLTPRSSPVAVVGGIGFDNRSATNVIAIPVTPGTVYRVLCPNGREAKFGSANIGYNIERVSIEYDV